MNPSPRSLEKTQKALGGGALTGKCAEGLRRFTTFTKRLINSLIDTEMMVWDFTPRTRHRRGIFLPIRN